MSKYIGKNSSDQSIIAVSLVTALCLIGDSMLYIALPIYYKEVGLQSLWEVGLILSLNRLIRIPVNPFIGLAYRKITLKFGLMIAVFLAVVTTIGYGVGYGLIIWIILRCLWGVSWAFLRLGGLFAVAECSTNSNRGRLMGLYNGLYRLGSLFGMLVGGILVSYLGLKVVGIAFGALMILGFPLIAWLVPRKHVERERKVSTNTSITRLFNKSVILVVISGLLLAFIIQGLFVSTLSLVMLKHYSHQVQIIGMTIGVTSLAGIVQGIRWAWEPFVALKFGQLSDGKDGRLPLFIMFLTSAAICLALIPISMPLYIWIIITIFFMLSTTIITTLVDALATDVGKTSDINIVMTYYTVFLDVGAALGPIIAYLIISFGNGLNFSYYIGALIFLIVAAIWLREYKAIVKEQRRQPNSSVIH
ncbi:hypothetical protein BKP45_12585 [Anaerobacillus alkalidiazotrophicus]|uniref:Major facilitator superfamily (MFS) profile domain-containing protein n=1 Tax=Anaerobacillus alkalidiazotrophicus TaxID=472963 RepID=A0A1S2M5Z0_9BACI|nr:MFS transporter [Anaerobacillus alkalidiazotrophicus]OIJ18404.1 hypothetical protein BKP45_18300 [Anaerobacillus alkalidiazotrophicus]OIJ19883.1 hypothetical protein BKP45_12585 [Anaerobacillus alkalidiazotrophicus]